MGHRQLSLLKADGFKALSVLERLSVVCSPPPLYDTLVLLPPHVARAHLPMLPRSCETQPCFVAGVQMCGVTGGTAPPDVMVCLHPSING